MIIGEGTLMVAMITRLPQPEINLAAVGGIVRAMTFAIESPILMLLTASATLCKDWNSYRRLRTFTIWGILILTGMHAVIALTPVYDLLTEGLIHAPSEIIEPGRIGLMITIPYLAAVAYRRLNHGVLIRFGYSRAIAFGTGVRLAFVIAILFAGLTLRAIPGVIVAALAMTIGVTVEAIYIELRIRPVRRTQLPTVQVLDVNLTTRRFLRFYIPLATTSIAMFAMQPIVSAALSRMPATILSLAVWSPVVSSAMLLASGGTAIVDVVVTLLDRPNGLARLRHFTRLQVIMTGVVAFAIAATPAGALWFGAVSGLTEPMLGVARNAFWIAMIYPVTLGIYGFYQGVLTHVHQTRRITEGVFLYIVIYLTILALGVFVDQVDGIYVGIGALVTATIAQTIWLCFRSGSAIKTLER